MLEWKGWKAIARDVLLMWILSGISGFLIGFVLAMTGRSSLFMAAICLSNFICAVIVFFISGCLIRENRWEHLVKVAFFTWLTSLVNFLLGFTSFSNWLLSIFAVLIFMAIGGGLSSLFVKAASVSPE